MLFLHAIFMLLLLCSCCFFCVCNECVCRNSVRVFQADLIVHMIIIVILIFAIIIIIMIIIIIIIIHIHIYIIVISSLNTHMFHIFICVYLCVLHVYSDVHVGICICYIHLYICVCSMYNHMCMSFDMYLFT